MTLVVVAEGIGVLARYPGITRLGPAVALNGLLGLALIAADKGIGVEKAIEVAGLVLQAAGEKTIAFYGDIVAIFILAGYAGPAGMVSGISEVSSTGLMTQPLRMPAFSDGSSVPLGPSVSGQW